MALSHGVVSITTAATLVSAATGGRDGQTVLVQNPAAGVDVKLGGEGVTAASYGYIIVAGSAFAIDLQAGESLYAVVASGTQSVSVLRQGV